MKKQQIFPPLVESRRDRRTAWNECVPTWRTVAGMYVGMPRRSAFSTPGSRATLCCALILNHRAVDFWPRRPAGQDVSARDDAEPSELTRQLFVSSVRRRLQTSSKEQGSQGAVLGISPQGVLPMLVSTGTASSGRGATYRTPKERPGRLLARWDEARRLPGYRCQRRRLLQQPWARMFPRSSMHPRSALFSGLQTLRATKAGRPTESQPALIRARIKHRVRAYCRSWRASQNARRLAGPPAGAVSAWVSTAWHFR